MSMVRPSGKALKIAKRAVPGLARHYPTRKKSSYQELDKDDVELKMIRINESPDRLENGRRLQPRKL